MFYPHPHGGYTGKYLYRRSTVAMYVFLQVFTPTIDTSPLERYIPDQDVNQQENYLIYGVTFLLFVKSNVNRVLLNMNFFQIFILASGLV